jgi:hypothetical protein
MKTPTMTEVAASLRACQFNPDADLPLPNIYWCSVYMPGVGEFHTHLAGAHTRIAVFKMADWCSVTHGARPYRSNSVMKLRRLKLGDLIENPAAYQIAMDNAKWAGEGDTVVALEGLPLWIAAHVQGLNPSVRQLRAANDSEALCQPLSLDLGVVGLSA